MVRTYSLDEVVVSIDGRRITEFATGDAISAELDDDDWAVTQGSHGAVIRARKHNNVATVTMNLTQGSPSNQWLSELAAADLEAGSAFDLLIMDARATRSFLAGRAWVKKRASLAFGDEAGQLEWVFTVGDVRLSHGTNDVA